MRVIGTEYAWKRHVLYCSQHLTAGKQTVLSMQSIGELTDFALLFWRLFVDLLV